MIGMRVERIKIRGACGADIGVLERMSPCVVGGSLKMSRRSWGRGVKRAYRATGRIVWPKRKLSGMRLPLLVALNNRTFTGGG